MIDMIQIIENMAFSEPKKVFFHDVSLLLT